MTVVTPVTAIVLSILSLVMTLRKDVRTQKEDEVDDRIAFLQQQLGELRVKQEDCERRHTELAVRNSQLQEENLTLLKRLVQRD